MGENAVDAVACLDENTVVDYLEGRLAGTKLEQVVRHADGCESCRRLIQQAMSSSGPVVRPPNPVGSVLAGKYRIERLIGSGGMGAVYEAVNTWTSRRVAIKLLHPYFSAEPEVAQRFLQEAKSATRIDHPNVVDVLDMGQEPSTGMLYMVQEYLVGETLRERLRGGKLSFAEACDLLLPILEALDAAHRVGVVHRDVKPENIFLARRQGAQPEPKLIDFGVSKVLARELPPGLTTEKPIGTPLYMSPEQLRVEDDIDGRSDIWSMGVVLYEALCGRRPFEARSHAEVATLILGGRFPAVREVAPDVPVRVASAISRSLSLERESRFSTIRELMQALIEARSTPPPIAARPIWIPIAIAITVVIGAGFLVLRNMAQHQRADTLPTVRQSEVPPVVVPPPTVPTFPAVEAAPAAAPKLSRAKRVTKRSAPEAVAPHPTSAAKESTAVPPPPVERPAAIQSPPILPP